MGFCSPNYSPIPPVRNTNQQKPRVSLLTSTPITDRELCLNTSDPTHYRGKAKLVNSLTEPQEPTKKSLKGVKLKSSQGAQPKNIIQPSTSSHTPSNGEWRPLVHCSTCRGDHLRKECCCDTFCTRCRSRLHNTDMCRAPTEPEKENNICIYCGSKSHSSGKCTSRPNDNREEPRSTSRNLQDCRTGNTGSKNHVFNQNRDSHHQTRFGKRFNRQYLPNYNNFQTSPLGSILGQELSAALMELANIQSKSLEMMAASQISQQEAFNELTKASKDKANDAMFASIKTYDGKKRQVFEDWIDKIDQACRASGCNFRMGIIKKSMGAVHQVVMTSDNCSDDELLSKLRSCFSDTPTMNVVWEELRNLRQKENESIAVYAYKWGCALVRSSGIHPENETHPHTIKDFISSLQRNISNKITSKWAEMRNPPRTVQEAFNLADRIESQIQVADSFKLELINDFSPVEVNEISTDKTSVNEYEINEVS